YENFQLQSIGDLTGAHIEGTRPIAAYSGNIKTNIGTGRFQDHLVEQLTPVDTWGRKFMTAPIPKRTVGDYFRIVASEDNTEVRIAGLPSLILQKRVTGIDGFWGSWGPWSGSCSVTCGKGVQFRNRTCDNPAPTYNGKNCTCSGHDIRPCNTRMNCPSE
ncbi:uncharacterized protein LOC143081005, partial [Mytilus galloprovincialis]|uniref:uncharacterized protein LOC143081005 n=1 Tax=Mytilus galloprovincialis TaxID=29158 RepID=UPI003F7C510A